MFGVEKNNRVLLMELHLLYLEMIQCAIWIKLVLIQRSLIKNEVGNISLAKHGYL